MFGKIITLANALKKFGKGKEAARLISLALHPGDPDSWRWREEELERSPQDLDQDDSKKPWSESLSMAPDEYPTLPIGSGDFDTDPPTEEYKIDMGLKESEVANAFYSWELGAEEISKIPLNPIVRFLIKSLFPTLQTGEVEVKKIEEQIVGVIKSFSKTSGDFFSEGIGKEDRLTLSELKTAILSAMAYLGAVVDLENIYEEDMASRGDYESGRETERSREQFIENRIRSLYMIAQEVYDGYKEATYGKPDLIGVPAASQLEPESEDYYRKKYGPM